MKLLLILVIFKTILPPFEAVWSRNVFPKSSLVIKYDPAFEALAELTI